MGKGKLLHEAWTKQMGISISVQLMQLKPKVHTSNNTFNVKITAPAASRANATAKTSDCKKLEAETCIRLQQKEKKKDLELGKRPWRREKR